MAELKNNQVVTITYNGESVKGKVKGIASGEYPILGRMIIVEVKIPEYPYSCIAVPEEWISATDSK